jgi:hypothetical protein
MQKYTIAFSWTKMLGRGKAGAYRYWTLVQRGAAVLVAGFCLLGAVGPNAHAVESSTPFLPGVTIGTPVGTLPPAGLYFSLPTAVFDLNVKNAEGQSIGVRAVEPLMSPQLTYIPDIPKIFGATYGMFIGQPVGVPITSAPGLGTLTNVGTVNTVISPLNLAWNLGGGFFVNCGVTTYGPAFTYRVGSIENTSRNYATIEPGVGLTYLNGGWNISIHPIVDLNFVNPADGYESGDLFMMDYTALRSFGKFEVGLGGTLTAQFSNDSINGIPVAAVPGINGYGNRAEQLTIGPIVGYDFGKFALTAYAVTSIYARNTAGGDYYWLRFDIPIFSSAKGPPY